MAISQKSKRITWAPDVNLCQVRLFSSAKPPSEVGTDTQVRLQAKAMAPWPSQPDESLPPGFEDSKPANFKLPQIPFKKWRCPPRYEVKSEWQVVSGEESKEIESQNQRERRALEAIYPRPSAIPPNPRLPVNAGESIIHDQNIPLIPVTPIEDANAEDASSLSQAANSSQMIPQPRNGVDSPNIAQISPQPDIVAAALASVLSKFSNDDQRNLIDHELLIRILTNPKMLQQLITQKMPSSTEYIPNMKLQPKSYTDSTNIGINGEASLSAQRVIPTQPTLAQLNAAAPVTEAAPPQLRTGFVSTSCPPVADISSAKSPCIVKDMNYYKSLIQQHGGVRVGVGVGVGVRVGGVPLQSCGQSNRMMGASQTYRKSRDEMKSRIMKPCIYFNSPRGCKNGANCAYQHDTFSSRKRVGCVTEVVAAKRVKLGR